MKHMFLNHLNNSEGYNTKAMSFFFFMEIKRPRREGQGKSSHFQILGHLIYGSEKKDSFSRVQDEWLSTWKNKSLPHTIYNKFIPVLQAYPKAELAVHWETGKNAHHKGKLSTTYRFTIRKEKC